MNADKHKWQMAGWPREVGLLVLGVLLIAATAQITVTLPFTRVPITGQTCGVALTGALLGARRGVLAVLLYLAAGVAGLPVFAGGSAGLAKLLGPTGGYLIGFILAAGIIGRLLENGRGRWYLTAWGVFLLGDAIILTCGVLRLAQFVGGRAALMQGVLPFVPGAIVKSGLSALILTLLQHFAANAEARTE